MKFSALTWWNGNSMGCRSARPLWCAMGGGMGGGMDDDIGGGGTGRKAERDAGCGDGGGGGSEGGGGGRGSRGDGGGRRVSVVTICPICTANDGDVTVTVTVVLLVRQRNLVVTRRTWGPCGLRPSGLVPGAKCSMALRRSSSQRCSTSSSTERFLLGNSLASKSRDEAGGAGRGTRAAGAAGGGGLEGGL